MTQFLEYAGRLSEFTGGTLRLELHDVAANDERAMALLTAHAERAGGKLEEDVVQVIGIRDGKWTEVWLYWADLYPVDEFFS